MTTARKRQQEWSPRLWHGGDLFAWMRLLVRNHFAVQPAYLYIAAITCAASVFNSMMRVLSDACFGGRIARTPFSQAPLFIVGHWRTGTTLLHELTSAALARGERLEALTVTRPTLEDVYLELTAEERTEDA